MIDTNSKEYIKVVKKLLKSIQTINAEVAELVRYTGDDKPLLDSDGDFYGLSEIVYNEETFSIRYSMLLSDRTLNAEEPVMIEDEDGEMFILDDATDFLKSVRRDCKRGLKDFRMFNPDTDEDENGMRKDSYMDKLVSESLQEFVKGEMV